MNGCRVSQANIWQPRAHLRGNEHAGASYPSLWAHPLPTYFYLVAYACSRSRDSFQALLLDLPVPLFFLLLRDP